MVLCGILNVHAFIDVMTMLHASSKVNSLAEPERVYHVGASPMHHYTSWLYNSNVDGYVRPYTRPCTSTLMLIARCVPRVAMWLSTARIAKWLSTAHTQRLL